MESVHSAPVHPAAPPPSIFLDASYVHLNDLDLAHSVVGPAPTRAHPPAPATRGLKQALQTAAADELEPETDSTREPSEDSSARNISGSDSHSVVHERAHAPAMGKSVDATEDQQASGKIEELEEDDESATVMGSEDIGDLEGDKEKSLGTSLQGSVAPKDLVLGLLREVSVNILLTAGIIALWAVVYHLSSNRSG